MKNIVKKIKDLNKSKQFQIVLSIIVIVVAFVVAMVNMIGIWEIPDNKLLNIIIFLLSGVAIIYVIEEIDVFEEIKKQVGDFPDKLQGMETELLKREEEFQEAKSKIESIENTLVEVHKLVKDTHTTKGVIVSRTKLEKSKSLDEVWNGADEICLLAIANTSFLRGNGISKIKEAVNRGVKFKLVSLDPSYSAIKEYEESGIISPTSLPVSGNVNAYINNCTSTNGRNGRKKETNDFKTMVEFRLTTYLLPYSMMIVKKNGKTSTIKVDLYGVDMEYLERRSFYIPADDEENIQFYEDQWNTVWEDSKKTVNVDVTKTY